MCWGGWVSDKWESICSHNAHTVYLRKQKEVFTSKGRLFFPALTVFYLLSSLSTRMQALWGQELTELQCVLVKQEHGEIGLMTWVQILEWASTSHVFCKLVISLNLTGLTYGAEFRRPEAIYTQHIVASDTLLLVWKYETRSRVIPELMLQFLECLGAAVASQLRYYESDL